MAFPVTSRNWMRYFRHTQMIHRWYTSDTQCVLILRKRYTISQNLQNSPTTQWNRKKIQNIFKLYITARCNYFGINFFFQGGFKWRWMNQLLINERTEYVQTISAPCVFQHGVCPSIQNQQNASYRLNKAVLVRRSGIRKMFFQSSSNFLWDEMR